MQPETKELINNIETSNIQQNIGYMALLHLAEPFYQVFDHVFDNGDFNIKKLKYGLSKINDGLRSANSRTYEVILKTKAKGSKQLADQLLMETMKHYENLAVYLLTELPEKVEALSNIAYQLRDDSIEMVANRLGMPIIDALNEDDHKSFVTKCEIYQSIRGMSLAQLNHLKIIIKQLPIK